MRSDFDQIWSGFDQILIKIVIFRLLLIYKRKWSQMASGFHRIRSDCDPNRDASLFAYIATRRRELGFGFDQMWSNRHFPRKCTFAKRSRSLPEQHGRRRRLLCSEHGNPARVFQIGMRAASGPSRTGMYYVQSGQRVAWGALPLPALRSCGTTHGCLLVYLNLIT